MGKMKDSNLDKVVGIWSDLESSYLEYSKTNNINRIEYVRKLLAYTDGKPSIQKIKSIIDDGKQDENIESEIIYIMNKVADYINGVDELNTLSELVTNSLSTHKKRSNEVISTRKVKTVSLCEAVERRLFSNATFTVDGVVKAFIPELIENYCIFNNNNDVINFVKKFKENNKRTEFDVAVIESIKNLINNNNYPIAFVGGDHFAVNKRTIEFAGNKIVFAKSKCIKTSNKHIHLSHEDSISGKVTVAYILEVS